MTKECCPGKIFNIDNTRFFTYAGLVVATAIILHKNLVVASVVGGVVAAYISFTEYYLANNDIRDRVTSDASLSCTFPLPFSL